jgi:hypothetical protein
MLLAGAGVATAGIEWQKNDLVLEVHPTQLAAEAVFPFKNTGDEPASIDEVYITCSCLSSKPLKESYAPGEEGELVIRFDLRERTGKQEKAVLVGSSDDEEMTELRFTTDIPQNYVFDSKFIDFVKGDTEKTKTIRLKNPNKKPIKLLSINSSHEDLPATLKTIREGFEYEVSVERKSTEKSIRSVIRIATEPPPGEKQAKTIHLYVFSDVE